MMLRHFKVSLATFYIISGGLMHDYEHYYSITKVNTGIIILYITVKNNGELDLCQLHDSIV